MPKKSQHKVHHCFTCGYVHSLGTHLAGGLAR